MTKASVVAGAGLGCFFGVAMGLSASPLVSATMGTLVALTGVFLGFKETKADVAEPETISAASSARLWGVGSFGLFCSLGIIAGLWIRTHDSLAASPQQQVNKWIAASFDSATSRAIVKYQVTGLIPENTKTATPAPNSRNSVLFGADVNECDKLNPSNYSDAKDLRTLYVLTGGGWKTFALAMDSVETHSRLRAFTATWTLVCSR
jgi:hypothetical protein